MILLNVGNNEYAMLKLVFYVRFLQSINFGKIFLSGPWRVSLVHSKKLI